MQNTVSDDLVFSFTFLFLVLIIWTMFWKAMGLWHSARKDKVWFIVIMCFNTLGILELIYLHSRGKLKRGKLFSNK